MYKLYSFSLVEVLNILISNSFTINYGILNRLVSLIICIQIKSTNVLKLIFS